MHSRWGNDFLSEAKERRRTWSHQFAECHPVLALPGWITDKLDPVSRHQLLSEAIQTYQILELDVQLRVISPHGIEIRLTPRPKGLLIQWRYHLPALGPDKPACDVLLSKWLDGHPFAANVEKVEGIVLWKDLQPEADVSAHEIVEFYADVARIPQDPSALTVRYIPAGLLDGALMRLPGCDLMVGTESDQSLRLSRSDHFDGPYVNRLLSKNMRLLSSVSSATLRQAARRLDKETRAAPLKYRLQTKFRNSKTIGWVLACDMRRILGRWLTPLFKKKETPT